MKFFAVLFFAVFLFLGADLQAKSWFDQSHEIFLPPELNAKLSTYRDFPLFWWNFLVLEYQGEEIPWESAEKICLQLVTNNPELIAKAPCPAAFPRYKEILKDWVHDSVLRQDPPSPAQFRRAFDQSLAKASFPLGASLLDFVRLDPLNEMAGFLARAQEQVPLQLEQRQGYFIDSKQKRLLIPLQLSFSSTLSAKMRELTAQAQALCKDLSNCRALTWIGPHASTLENETQVRSDMEIVSVVGALLLVILAGGLIWTKRTSLLALVPLLFLSILGATLTTIAIFGSIHGIVLSFGPGIVGLAMDYGIHSAFMDPKSKKTWNANFLGILTTLVVLVVMFFSQIPLIRELMFFSMAGLIFGFLLFYIFMHRFADFFSLTTYPLQPSKSKIGGAMSALLLLGVFLFPVLKVSLDLRQMNFESPQTFALHNWLFSPSQSKTSLILTEPTESAFASSQTELKWAQENKIGYQGISSLLPSEDVQKTHLENWKKLLCPTTKINLSETDKKFFAPFFKEVNCENLRVRDLKNPPAYLMDQQYEGHWLSLFFANNTEQEQKIKTQFPSASSPGDLFSQIPTIFGRELAWMMPLSIFAALFILFLYYREVRKSLLAMIPFLTGLGTFFWICWIFSMPITFVSVIGLIMVFGMSLDYGVFVINFMGLKEKSAIGVWSALTLCGYVTTAGFFPLVFAKHPVMFQLGQSLTWGAVGTYLGSVFTLPWLAFLWSPKEKI